MNSKKFIYRLIILTMLTWVSNSVVGIEESPVTKQKPTVGSIFGTDETPSPEMLVGPINDSNRSARSGFYTRKSYILTHSAIQPLSKEEEINIRVKEHDLGMQKGFGTDFSLEKRKNLSQIYRNMLEEDEKLRKQFYDGKISEKKLKKLSSEITEKWLQDSAEVLDDKEFEFFFEFKKSDIKNYVRALSQSIAE